MRAWERIAGSTLAASLLAVRVAAAQNLDPRQVAAIEQALQREGEAVVALADDPASHADFPLAWHNDFFKAQSGAFVPFVAGIIQPEPGLAGLLLYVRVAPREGPAAFEEIYPVLPAGGPGQLTRVVRGFAVAPGEYDVTLVARERERGASRRRPRASVLRVPLSVPDFSTRDLMTSTVVVGDRLTILPAPADPLERPYAIGSREIHPAPDRIFGAHEELVVAFLVYNPAVTPDEHFDLEVEYHFLRTGRDGAGDSPGPPLPAARPGETYVNRTEPQRFTPAVLGPGVGPAAGQPILAGQGVPLSSFQQGDYRLVIRVADLVSGRVIDREITFTVER